jgi:type I protein arginine methyltransferase
MLQKEINEIGQFIPLHYHFQMLSDTSRMTAFRSAIEQIVTPQSRVAELGSGSGVLSFFAAKQGARVWAVEYNPALVSASRKFLSENGLSDRVQVFHADASSWLPPEPVDLVICEMLHSALLREKQVQVMSAFRDAHLARFGTAPRMLPNVTLLGVQPTWQCYDFNGYLAPVPLFQSPYATVDNFSTHGDPVVYKIIDYDKDHMKPIESDVLFPIWQDTEVNSLRFITKSLLTMDLTTGQTIDWHSQHLILPLHRSLQLKSGQVMRVRFSYRPGDPIETLQNTINTEIVGHTFAEDQLSLIA